MTAELPLSPLLLFFPSENLLKPPSTPEVLLKWYNKGHPTLLHIVSVFFCCIIYIFHLAVKVQSPFHWTAREVPNHYTTLKTLWTRNL